MKVNLLESLREHFGYPAFPKVDPNTQEVKHEEAGAGSAREGQAAITAVLMALYKYGSTELGANEILHGNTTTGWAPAFFGDRQEDAVQRVAAYAGSSTDGVAGKMEDIAREAIRLIRENTPEKATFADVKAFIAEQRHTILVYVPAELQIGELLNDTTLDDRTNKMEGPLSGHMHFLEKLFSGSSTEKYERKADEDEKK